MQHLARRDGFPSIKSVANHGVAEMMKMNANLVSTPAMEDALNQTDSA